MDAERRCHARSRAALRRPSGPVVPNELKRIRGDRKETVRVTNQLRTLIKDSC
jgi:hypothetical protein